MKLMITYKSLFIYFFYICFISYMALTEIIYSYQINPKYLGTITGINYASFISRTYANIIKLTSL